NRANIGEKAAGLMEERVRGLRLQRPPAAEEPDLSWRGIASLTEDSLGYMVRVGGGFIKLAQKDPPRARFELARLLAQSWAPCELTKNGVDGAAIWAPLLKCLGVEEKAGCAAGSYSEAGWAISTTLAAVVANPGCTVPAFAEAERAKCV